MAKVFLSHNSAQKELVEEIANAIGRDFVYFDKYNFTEGNLLEDEIEKKIKNSDIFVLFLSDDAFESKWVKFEMQIARDLVEDGDLVFLPIVVDETLVPERDSRVPKWVKKYILKFSTGSKLMARNIQQRIRQLTWERTHESIFKSRVMIGRDSDLDEIGTKYFSTLNHATKAIVVSGLQHSGRKRLLMETLMRKIQPDKPKAYSPIVVSLTENDSIEYLITQLDQYLEYKAYKQDIYATMALGKKECCDLCVRMLNDLADHKEHVFVNDNGSIISGNGYYADWFVDIIENPALVPQNHFYVASQFTPRDIFDNQTQFDRYIIHHKISLLSKSQIVALFNSYASELRLFEMNEDDANFFISQVNGSPEMVITILDDVKKSGTARIKREIRGIVGMHDRSEYLPMWESLQKKKNIREVLLVMSHFEFLTYDILCTIFPNYEINEILNKIECYSLLEIFGPSQQYLRLNSLFSDFLVRAKYQMDIQTKQQLDEYTKTVIADVDVISNDLAEQLFKIKEAIKNPDAKVDNKYLLPSIALNVIVEEYRAGHYKSVIAIANKVLYDYKADKYETVERAIRYWMCLAYCKQGDDDKVREEVQYFSSRSQYTYYFILGYSCRQKGYRYYKNAISFYKSALSHYKHVSASFLSKAEHELVITQMKLGGYDDALVLARKCYEMKPDNQYFIETYARCLLRAKHPDEVVFRELIKRMKTSRDPRKQAIVKILTAEALFYIGHNPSGAVESLENLSAEFAGNWKTYIDEALALIAKEQDMHAAYYKHQKALTEPIDEYDDILDMNI